MDDYEDIGRIQVLSVSDTGRCRRWSDDEKIRIVEESSRSGLTIAEVARRHEISRSQLYDWRYRYRSGLLGCGTCFTPLIPVADGRAGGAAGIAARQHVPEMTIEVGDMYRVRISSDFDMDAAACLIRGLAGHK